MATRVRILYLITQSQWGGAQRYVFDLATNLGRDFDVLVAAGSPEARGKDLLRECKTRGIETVRLRHLIRPIHPIRDISAVFEVHAVLKKTRPALVHVNSSKAGVVTSFASLLLPRRIRPKLVYTAHGWVFNEPGSFLKRQLWRVLEKVSARPKNAIICVSWYDRKTALEFRIAPPEKLVTIHNGIPQS